MWVAGRGGGKKAPLPKTCHTYPTMMKLGTVIHYLEKIQSLSSANISIFSLEISNFCYINKHRLHFNT